MRALRLLPVFALGVVACDPPENAPKAASASPTREPSAAPAKVEPAPKPEPTQLAGEAKRAPVDPPQEKAPELTPAELKAALDLASELGKNGAKLAENPDLEDGIAKKVAKRNRLSVKQLDGIYARAMVSHQAEIIDALNAGAR